MTLMTIFDLLYCGVFTFRRLLLGFMCAFVLYGCGAGDETKEPTNESNPSLAALRISTENNTVTSTASSVREFQVVATWTNGETRDVSQVAEFEYSTTNQVKYQYANHYKNQIVLDTGSYGTLYVMARYQGFLATLAVDVEPIITHILLSPADGTLVPSVDNALSFTARAVWSNQRVEDITQDTQFTHRTDGTVPHSAQGNRVTIGTSATGTLHTTASYTHTQFGEFTANATINMLAASVSVTAVRILDAPTILEYQQTAQLTGRVELSDGSVLNNPANASWRSSDTTHLRISETGEVASRANDGNETITFTYGGTSTSVSISSTRTLTQLAFEQSSYWMQVDTSLDMHNAQLIAQYSNGATEAVLNDALLSVADTQLANIGAYVSGSGTRRIISNSGSGETSITARITRGIKTLSQSVPLHVQAETDPIVVVELAHGHKTTALQQVAYSVTTPASAEVSHVLVSTDSNTPSINDSRWQSVNMTNGVVQQGSYTFTRAGTSGYVVRTLYAWGKNQFNTISAATVDTILQTEPIVVGASTDATNPLAYQQWYLSNRGQTGFAARSGTASGMNGSRPLSDMQLSKTHQQYGLKGHGVVVSVLDSGLDVDHEDFADVNLARSDDYRDGIGGDTNPTPTSTGGDHGTSVAGIIAMKDGNGLGGVGVSPAVQLTAHNIITYFARSYFSNALLQDGVDVVNMSLGFNKTDLSSGNQGNNYATSFLAGRDQRSGKGIIYVQSAGNGFTSYASGVDCTSANNHGVSCQNAAHDDLANNLNVIVVAAVNANGEKSSYSATGPNIWVSGFGGEFGVNINQTGYSSQEFRERPALITTDIAGCQTGSSRAFASSSTGISLVIDYLRNIKSAFNFGFNTTPSNATAHPENTQCNYTNTFNGTSAAAPSITGVVALLLQANPELSWREVKDIFARTSRMPAHQQTTQQGYILTQGVITNAAGYQFNNWYGFGVVDADKAVEMAMDYQLGSLGTLHSVVRQENSPVNVPDANPNGVSKTISTTIDLTIEAVQVVVNIDHDRTSDIALYLTSPSGTTHQLINHFHGVNTDYNNVVLTSNAFYGESSDGTWTLQAIDSSSGGTGSLDDWELRIFGHSTEILTN